MKRALLGLALGLGIVTWWAWPGPTTAVPTPDRPGRRVTRFAHEVDATAPVPHPFQAVFTERSAHLERACGLEIQTTCEGSTCVSVTVAPDLDGFSGWVELLATSPSFVWSTAMRDLGLPSASTSCGDALDALPYGALQVERDDGTEVWCAIDDPSRDPGWEERARGLCDGLAVHLGAGGFADPEVRILAF